MKQVVRIAARGDGVTADGTHVPLAAPGDLVAEDGTVAAGPHRQIPPCRHFPECGGCQLQHVDDEAYAEYLAVRIAWALTAQGVDAPGMKPAHISPPNSRRRATLSAERRGGQLLLGFNEEASHRIVDMRECHVLRPELFALVAPLRSLLASLLPSRGRGSASMILSDQGVDLMLTGVSADDLATTEELAGFAEKHRLARLAIDDGYGAQTRWEPEAVTVTLGGIPVSLPHGAFLQATAEGETALVEAVRDAVGQAATSADLFSGLGTFALALDGRVLAAEGARDAALALKAAAARSGRQVFVDHRDLFRRPFTAAELSRFDAVVLDPPRAGAKEQAGELARSDSPRIAYVSCNPNTFARDAKMLVEGGYRLEWVKPVGQFRWSTHVELVGAFRK